MLSNTCPKNLKKAKRRVAVGCLVLHIVVMDEISAAHSWVWTQLPQAEWKSLLRGDQAVGKSLEMKQQTGLHRPALHTPLISLSAPQPLHHITN